MSQSSGSLRLFIRPELNWWSFVTNPMSQSSGSLRIPFCPESRRGVRCHKSHVSIERVITPHSHNTEGLFLINVTNPMSQSSGSLQRRGHGLGGSWKQKRSQIPCLNRAGHYFCPESRRGGKVKPSQIPCLNRAGHYNRDFKHLAYSKTYRKGARSAKYVEIPIR